MLTDVSLMPVQNIFLPFLSCCFLQNDVNKKLQGIMYFQLTR